MLRDWQREKIELKEKTVKLIEEQIEETSAKLKADFEAAKSERIRLRKHEELDELKKEYLLKMEIINEIKQQRE